MHATPHLSRSSCRGDVGGKGEQESRRFHTRTLLLWPVSHHRQPSSRRSSSPFGCPCYSTIWLSNPSTKVMMDDTQLPSDLPMTHIASTESSFTCVGNGATGFVTRSHEKCAGCIYLKSTLFCLVQPLECGNQGAVPFFRVRCLARSCFPLPNDWQDKSPISTNKPETMAPEWRHTRLYRLSYSQ